MHELLKKQAFLLRCWDVATHNLREMSEWHPHTAAEAWLISLEHVLAQEGYEITKKKEVKDE